MENNVAIVNKGLKGNVREDIPLIIMNVQLIRLDNIINKTKEY